MLNGAQSDIIYRANYIAAVGGHNVSDFLISSLKRMEQCGARPTGLAVVDGRGKIRCMTRPRQVEGLMSMPSFAPVGRVGLAAGSIMEIDPALRARRTSFGRIGRVCVVCSGEVDIQIDSNSWLSKYGVSRNNRSDADIIAYHINHALKNSQSWHVALRRVTQFVPGAFSIAAVIEGEVETLIATSKGAPLHVGAGRDGFYIASDASLLSDGILNEFIIEGGDALVISNYSIDMLDASGEPVLRGRVCESISEAMLPDGRPKVRSNPVSGTVP